MAREESMELASPVAAKEDDDSLGDDARQSFTVSKGPRTVSSATCGVWKLALLLFLFLAVCCLGFVIIRHLTSKGSPPPTPDPDEQQVSFQVTSQDREHLAKTHERWSQHWEKVRCTSSLPSVNTFLLMLNAQLLPKELVDASIYFSPDTYDEQESHDMSNQGERNKGMYATRRKSDGKQVVIKVVREKLDVDGDSNSKLAAMYDMYARLQLIDCLQGNVLGYLEISFPLHEEAHIWSTQVRVDYGRPASYVQDSRPSWDTPVKHDILTVASIAVGVLRAVLALQDAGFVMHGVVNPSSILLPRREIWDLQWHEIIDAVRLTDNDAAILVGSGARNFVPPALGYGAPELYERNESVRTLSDKVDVFACGATIVTLATGKSIYEIANEGGIINDEWDADRKAHEAVLTFLPNFVEPDEMLTKVGRSKGWIFRWAFRGMLAPNPDNRWDTKRALTEMTNFLSGQKR